jgi:hypothetical protein
MLCVDREFLILVFGVPNMVQQPSQTWFHNRGVTCAPFKRACIDNFHLRVVCAVLGCGLQKYVQTPNLAEYLGLHTVDSLHMSVPLNAVFIGFKGEGNAKVCPTAHQPN